jgi:hypothetical protein
MHIRDNQTGKRLKRAFATQNTGYAAAAASALSQLVCKCFANHYHVHSHYYGIHIRVRVKQRLGDAIHAKNWQPKGQS